MSLDQPKTIVSCRELYKSYNSISILNGINLNVLSGETVSIVGSSGSGKSTLLHIIAGLDRVIDSGDVIFNHKNLKTMNDNQLCQLRNSSIGFVYQFHYLLPEFTVFENVALSIMMHHKINAVSKEYILYILNLLGLATKLEHYPSMLSGGERQRVAIARAIINKPQVIMADEPTGNLDNYNANIVLDIFLKLQQELKTSVILVTHDYSIANKTNHIYNLHNGILSYLK